MSVLNENRYLATLQARRDAAAEMGTVSERTRAAFREGRVVTPTGFLDPDSFGGILTELRTARSISQNQLSKDAGFCAQYVGRLERGHNLPSPDAAVRIAAALHLSPGDHARLMRAAEGGTSPTALLSRPTVTTINAAYRSALPKKRAAMEAVVARLIQLGAAAYERERGEQR